MLHLQYTGAHPRPTALDSLLAEAFATGCGFGVHKGGVDQPLAAGARARVVWAEQGSGRSRQFDLATGRFTCTRRGRYLFVVSGAFAGGPGLLFLYRNGVEVCQSLEGGTPEHVVLVAALLLERGDAIEVYASHDAGGALAGDPARTRFAGRLL